MKNLFKILIVPVSLAVFIAVFFIFQSFAVLDDSKDGDEKKVKIKMIKIVDGVETVVDTTFTITNDDELQTILSGLNLQGIECNTDSILQTIDLDIDGNGEKQIKMVVCTDGNGDNINIDSLLSTLDVIVDEVESGGEKIYTVKIGNDDGSDVVKTEKKIIISSDCDGGAKGNNKDVKVIVIGDDENSDKWDVIKEDDCIVRVKELNNGEKKIIIKSSVDTVCDKNNIKVIKTKDGKEEMIIHPKVCVVMLTDDDKEVFKKSGVKTMSEECNSLDVGELNFYPNPNTGKFNLKFNLENKEKTGIKIYDINGKVVYNEIINDFNGEYNKEIDISDKGKGTFFLCIMQGDKVMNKKIIIE
ncbi:MAG: T9SS type A sorting domain-containing protein [Bacteroidota bacterium]